MIALNAVIDWGNRDTSANLEQYVLTYWKKLHNGTSAVYIMGTLVQSLKIIMNTKDDEHACLENEPATDKTYYFCSRLTTGNDEGDIEHFEDAHHTFNLDKENFDTKTFFEN